MAVWYEMMWRTRSPNTATGFQPLSQNTTGANNTATGVNALGSSTEGSGNTAMGTLALGFNSTGGSNTAVGVGALLHNTTLSDNTAVGADALFNNIGSSNSTVGAHALENKTAGNQNTVVGFQAGALIDSGDGNVCIGANVLGSGSENNITRIRNIGATPIISSTNIVIAGIGGIGDQPLGYAASSQRYKQDIQPMDKASETLLALKPVTFRARQGIQPSGVKLHGLIAEDVAAVDPNLVACNAEGQPETVRFDSINAMLLNEFLKEHAIVKELKEEIAALKAGLQELTDQLKVRRSAQLAENSQ